MDILNKRIYKIGEIVYFLHCSENCKSVYLLIKGRIESVEHRSSCAYYSIRPIEFLDSPDFLASYLHDTSWKVHASKRAATITFKLYHKAIAEKHTISSYVIDKYFKKRVFEKRMTLVYDKLEDAKACLRMINSVIKDRLLYDMQQLEIREQYV